MSADSVRADTNVATILPADVTDDSCKLQFTHPYIRDADRPSATECDSGMNGDWSAEVKQEFLPPMKHEPEQVRHFVEYVLRCCSHASQFSWYCSDYLSEFCFNPSSHNASSNYSLGYINNNQLVIPPFKLTAYDERSFNVSGRTVWNILPDYLINPTLYRDVFKCYLNFPFAPYYRLLLLALYKFLSSSLSSLSYVASGCYWWWCLDVKLHLHISYACEVIRRLELVYWCTIRFMSDIRSLLNQFTVLQLTVLRPTQLPIPSGMGNK